MTDRRPLLCLLDGGAQDPYVRMWTADRVETRHGVVLVLVSVDEMKRRDKERRDQERSEAR